jgi:hypothetical protein
MINFETTCNQPEIAEELVNCRCQQKCWESLVFFTATLLIKSESNTVIPYLAQVSAKRRESNILKIFTVTLLIKSESNTVIPYLAQHFKFFLFHILVTVSDFNDV